MIEIDKDSESIKKSQFQEDIVLESYFACASRDEVLSQMKEAVQNGVAFMVLTGEEGSGKTTLCRLLEQEVSPLCKTVFFSRTVDSFEDVVRLIARGLGLGAAIEMDGRGVEQALEQITDFLQSETEDLLIIFDEAENIFLATLERIRKMLDRMIESGVRMSILLSGQQTLLENCEQLSLFDFQNADELHFELVPLTKAETADYLKSCAVQRTDLDANKVFVKEVVENIYSLAKGNFKTTHILGEESMKTPSDDTSFMVLLDDIKERFGSATENSDAIKLPQFLREYVAWLPWIGGALCCLLLLFFLFRSGDDESGVDLDVDQAEKTVQIEVVTRVREAKVQVPEDKEAVTVELTEKVQPPVEKEIEKKTDKETAVQPMEENSPGGEVVVVAPVEKSFRQNVDQIQRVVEQIAVEENEIVENIETIESATPVDAVEKVVVEAKEMDPAREIVKRQETNIVKLRSAHDIKKKPGPSSEPQQVIIKVQSRKEVRNVNTSNAHFTVEQLYSERLSAGLGWGGRKIENMYTVQLMVLASENAEENLKKMLAQVNYRQEAGNFYILKKATVPESIFVFYGEYPSLERAKLVTDSLPEFLRYYKPYALSVKGAITKVRK